jgi:Transport and Golgi organisation 2
MLRDENPSRRCSPPAMFETNGISYLMPVDSVSGGSWVGINILGTVVTLMNGGFEAHISQPPYRMSRGQIVKLMLESRMPVVDWVLLPTEQIEPHTLVVYSEGKLFRLVWDGEQKYRTVLDEGTWHIFSSATLYDGAARNKRKEFFDDWMVMSPPADRISLLNFFKSLKDEQNGFVMHRSPRLQTLSFSYLNLMPEQGVFHYYDLLNFRLDTQSISIEQAKICERT